MSLHWQISVYNFQLQTERTLQDGDLLQCKFSHEACMNEKKSVATLFRLPLVCAMVKVTVVMKRKMIIMIGNQWLLGSYQHMLREL